MAGVRLPFEVTATVSGTPGTSDGRNFSDWGLTVGANYYGMHPSTLVDDEGNDKPSSCVNVGKEMCVKACGPGEKVDLRTTEGMCARCNEPFDLENVYFYKCSWKTKWQKWQKNGNGQPKLFPKTGPVLSAPESSVEGEFKKFVPSEYQLYSELVIHVS